MNTNCVYVVVVNNYDGTVFYKIGVSNDVRFRISSIQTGCPIPIAHILHLPIPQGIISTKVEKHLHRKFKAYHTSGEWFRFDFRERKHREDFETGCNEVVNPILGKGWKWTTYTVAELKENGTEQTRKFTEKCVSEENRMKFRLQQRVKNGLSPSFWSNRGLHLL